MEIAVKCQNCDGDLEAELNKSGDLVVKPCEQCTTDVSDLRTKLQEMLESLPEEGK